MKSVLAWLDQEMTILRHMNDGSYKQTLKIIERLAELIAVNNGTTEVRTWGQVTPTNQSPYLRFGLTMDEALEMISMVGVFTGYTQCQNNPTVSQTATLKIQAEINRVKKEGFDPRKTMVPVEQKSAIGIYTEADMKLQVGLQKHTDRILKDG